MSNLRSKKLWTSSAVVAASVLLLMVALTHIGRAKPRPAAAPAPPPVVGCGSTDEVCREGVLQASYATAINIHNPNATSVVLSKSAVLALPEGNTLPSPSASQSVQLAAGQALEVDCYDIEVNLLALAEGINTGAFFKGFVTILASNSVDVVGVYSAQPPSVLIPLPNSTTGATQTQYPGLALEMLQIPQRITILPSSSGVPTPFYEYSAKFLCGKALPPVG